LAIVYSWTFIIIAYGSSGCLSTSLGNNAIIFKRSILNKGNIRKNQDWEEIEMKKNNRKKWIAAATALAALGVLVGTFAWFTSNDQTVNKFEGGVAGNDVEIVETFTPPED